jgi:hypothetical protein
MLSIDPSMIEMIMRRRKQTADPTPSVPIAPTGPSDTSTLPPKDSNVVAGPETPAPCVEKKVKSSKSAPNVLSALMSYGDDDDDDNDEVEEEEDNDNNDTDDRENDTKDEGGHDIEGTRLQMTNVLSSPISFPSIQFPPPVTVFTPPPPDQALSMPYPVPPPPLHSSGFDAPYASTVPVGTGSTFSGYSTAPVPSGPMIPEKPKQGKILKVMRPDAGLTAFLPSSLRAKRGGDTISKPGSKLLKTDRPESDSVSESVSGFKDESKTSGSVGLAPKNSVDDAYNDFLREINQLTGI